MIPFIVVVSAFVVFLVVGRAGVGGFRSWLTCLRWALAMMFLVTASAHWGDKRADLVQMVPASFPHPDVLVTITGIAEILGALGLLIPRVAPYAATGLALLLVAVFPANVHAASAELAIGGRPVMGVVPRALLQLGFLGGVLVAGFWPRSLQRARSPRVAP
jgi:uncharacterized membrane protein